jgi:hypothetical protein
LGERDVTTGPKACKGKTQASDSFLSSLAVLDVGAGCAGFRETPSVVLPWRTRIRDLKTNESKQGDGMFARVTKFKMKAGSIDAAVARMEELKPQIMALDGLHQFMNVMQADGAGYVISVVETEEKSNANASQVAALWGQMAEFLEGPPEPVGHTVMANWTT